MSKKRERPQTYDPMEGLGDNLDLIYGTHNPPGVHDSQVTKEIEVDAIQPNPFQPRQDFDEESLESLAISIQNHGIIQPLVVTFRNGTVYLVSGERRLRAARKAGRRTVPCIEQKDISDAEMEDMAFEENVHRKDLTPLEEAYAIDRYMQRHGISGREAAARRGISRATVQRRLALIRYPEIAQAVAEGRLAHDQAAAIAMNIERPGQTAIRQQILTILQTGNTPTPEQIAIASGEQPPAVRPNAVPVSAVADASDSLISTATEVMADPAPSPLAVASGPSTDLAPIPADAPTPVAKTPPTHPAVTSPIAATGMPAPPDRKGEAATQPPSGSALANRAAQQRRLQDLQELAAWWTRADLATWIAALPAEMLAEYLAVLRNLQQQIPAVIAVMQSQQTQGEPT
jgi:ParB/RepB/Spo0J family partition protein